MSFCFCTVIVLQYDFKNRIEIAFFSFFLFFLELFCLFVEELRLEGTSEPQPCPAPAALHGLPTAPPWPRAPLGVGHPQLWVKDFLLTSILNHPSFSIKEKSVNLEFSK